MKAQLLLLIALLFALSAAPSHGLAQAPITTEEDEKVAPNENDDLGKDVKDKADVKKVRFISLYIGVEEEEILPEIPVGFTASGDYKTVVTVQVNQNSGKIVFIPKKEGVGTLTLFDSKRKKLYEFRLDVKKSDLTKVAREIKALLADIEGIAIKIINNRVVIDGQILLPRDLSRITTVVNQYGDKVASSLVTLSPLAQRKIAQLMENDIHNPEITVRAVNDKFILEGTVGDKTESDRAYAIAQMYIPDQVVDKAGNETVKKVIAAPIINLITIKAAPEKPAGKVIQIVVHFVELKKDYAKSFNFSFAPTISDKTNLTFSNGSESQSGVISSVTGVVSNLLPKLNWGKQHGSARVLDTTEILVQDGKAGTLNRSTKYPYTILSSTGVPSVATADVGVDLQVTPKLLNPRSDNIGLDLTFDVKTLVGFNGNAPVINSSKIKTDVNVRSGQSAAIGGLIENSASTDYDRAPANTQNAIISLLASKQFQHNQTQFVVFVTPIVKSSASAGSETIKKKFRLKD